MYFKACLRCKDGTVELGADNYGSFLTCISCGYTINSRSIRSNGSIESPATMDVDSVVTPAIVNTAHSDQYGDDFEESDVDSHQAAEEVDPSDFDFDEVAAM